MTRSKRFIQATLVASFLALLGCDGASDSAASPPPAREASDTAGSADESSANILARGEYLVTIGGCHDCHTPWKPGPSGAEPDMSRALSGHPRDLVMPEPPPEVGPWLVASAGTNTAHRGPWGTSFTANLTPHDETGIGTWTAETFIETIRNGKHMGRGRPLLPPMPWPNYAKMTDEDLRAVFAYLQSIPAVDNRVPSPLPPSVSAPPV